MDPINAINIRIRKFCRVLNERFSAMSLKSQKGCIIIFVVLIGFVSMSLIVKGALNHRPSNHITVSQIKTPKNIYMAEKQTNDQLIIVGKLKGEIDGEFEAFYLAVDRKEQLYANRHLILSDQPFMKSPNWEMISRTQLAYYDKHLHFLPVRARSLTH